MKKTFLLKNIPLLLLATGLVLTMAFAQTTNSTKEKKTTTDTVPAKQKKIRDLDEALSEVDRGEAEMQKATKEINGEKIDAEIRKAMKALDEVDMAKIKEEVARAMKEVDQQKIELEVQKALKEVQSEKIQKEVQAALAQVDMEKVKAEVEKIKEVDMVKIKEELAKVQPEVEKAMKEAKVSIEKARKEVTAYRNLVNALDRDGLLNKASNYKVEYKNKELTVNGKKLSAEQTKKYSEYLQDRDDFKLEKNEDGLDINNNNEN